jgi:two-component system, OmpR family, phosphate regulon sensor histidine kinase PhoR
MLTSGRRLSLLLAFVGSTFCYFLLVYLGRMHFLLALEISVGLCLLIYATSHFVLHVFIFKELKSISTLLDKVKKKDYAHIYDKDYRYSSNPLDEIKQEITNFAKQKHMEISELQKLEIFRREFLADVSHELKTPIFSAQGFIHTLIDGAIDDEQVRDRFLQKAANSIEGLNVLVQDLITISQLEIGEIKMHFASFDLHKLTQDIFDQLEESAMNRGTRLRFNKFAPKSCYVFADKVRIGQVMTNLIVNAIKYGKEKGTVEVSFLIEGEDVHVSIKDNGPGIEEKHLSRIFERFYRIEKSRSKDQGGTGLGLAIVKHILEAHESRIQVFSVVNEGTEFSFTLRKGKVINEKG